MFVAETEQEGERTDVSDFREMIGHRALTRNQCGAGLVLLLAAAAVREDLDRALVLACQERVSEAVAEIVGCVITTFRLGSGDA